MNSTEYLWPALLDVYELGKLDSGKGADILGWCLLPGKNGVWRAEPVAEPTAWTTGKERITCDLTQPMPPDVAAEIGFFAHYLELLWRQHHSRHRSDAESRRPYTTACFAQSLDGFIATSNGDSQWIGNEENLLHAHRMRALHDAILVGCRTYLNDKPRLTVRHVTGEHPFRVVVTSRSELPEDLVAAITQPTLVIKPGTDTLSEADGRALQVAATERCVDGRYVCPRKILEILGGLGMRSLLIEGGGVTVSLFNQHRLLDQADIQIAPLFLGAGIRPLTVEAAAYIADAETHSARVSAVGDQSLMSLRFS